MIELTNAQGEILVLLARSISGRNFQEVENIFKGNEDSNIQKILRFVWTSDDKLRNTVLRVAIDSYNIHGQKEGIEIIELIWQKADQKTRDFLCSTEYNLAEGDSVSTINMLRDLQGQERTNDSNKAVLEEVIQEMEEHKRVMGLGSNLRGAMKNLDVDQVKAALKDCGTDIEKVLMQEVCWSDGSRDALLVFPLEVEYEKDLGKEEFEKIKKITKLLWDKASSNVRDFWLKLVLAKGDNYIIDSLEKQQGMYGNIAGEGWLEDFIQEVKDYRRQREIQLNDSILEEEDEQTLELAKQESLLTAPIATDTTEPTADNKTTEKNDTNFWSEHKEKIALSVVVLCAAGAVAVYVPAYPGCTGFSSFGSSYINGCWYC